MRSSLAQLLYTFPVKITTIEHTLGAAAVGLVSVATGRELAREATICVRSRLRSDESYSYRDEI